MSMMPAESSAHDHSELDGGSVFTPGCSPILEDQPCIDVKVFAAAIMHRRRVGRMDGCGSWRCCPNPKYEVHVIWGTMQQDQLPLFPQQSLVFKVFVLN
jgi:hypothetical protein